MAQYAAARPSATPKGGAPRSSQSQSLAASRCRPSCRQYFCHRILHWMPKGSFLQLSQRRPPLRPSSLRDRHPSLNPRRPANPSGDLFTRGNNTIVGAGLAPPSWVFCVAAAFRGGRLFDPSRLLLRLLPCGSRLREKSLARVSHPPNPSTQNRQRLILNLT